VHFQPAVAQVSSGVRRAPVAGVSCATTTTAVAGISAIPRRLASVVTARGRDD
jgi:hypothetical protein